MIVKWRGNEELVMKDKAKCRENLRKLRQKTPEDTKEAEEDQKPAGEMTQIGIKEGGIKQPRIESCGRTWGRPMSNKGLSKADDDDDDDDEQQQQQ